MTDAFQAGFDFFEGPQFDGHLRDRAPGESFDTKFGVTQMTYAAAVRSGVDVVSWDAIQEPEDVAPIYRANFYDANRCGEMPPAIAMIVFVDATLMGGGTPRRSLQTALGVVADGAIGPGTMAALAACDVEQTARRLEALDMAHLRSLPNWPQFAAGWTNRETKLLAAALELI